MRTAVIGIFALIILLFSIAPALADEFKVGILLDSTLSAGAEATFMEGFQLAVDQSPDVSHPPNTEGGDHLGSMDVVFVVVDDLSTVDEFRAAAINLVGDEGVSIIVADVSPSALEAIFEPITTAETMLITTTGLGGLEFPDTLFFFAAAEQEGTEVLLTDRSPAFEQAFATQYGRPASEAAARGYIAGRLVDLSVEATDRDPSDVQTMATALLAATDTPPTNEPSVANEDTTAESLVESSPSQPNTTFVVAAAAFLVIVGGTAFFIVWRKRTKRR